MSEIKVRRGNVVLRVSAEQKAEYLAKGFDVIEDGKVVEASVPNDVNILKRAYKEHLEKIESLEAEIKSLKKGTSKPKTTRTKKTDN